MHEITTTPLTIFVSTALLCITEGLFFWAYWRLRVILVNRDNERLKKDADFWRHRFDELAGQFLAYKRGGDALPNEDTYEPGQPFQPFAPWGTIDAAIERGIPILEPESKELIYGNWQNTDDIPETESKSRGNTIGHVRSFAPWGIPDNATLIEVQLEDTESYKIGETENYITFHSETPGLLNREILYKSSIENRVGKIIMAVPFMGHTEYTAAIPKAKV